MLTAHAPQSWTLLFPAPARLGRVFDQHIDARLMEPFQRQFTMSSLQFVGRDFRMGKESIGGLDLVPVPKGLRDALAGIGSKGRRGGDRPLVAFRVTQIQVAKLLLGPRLWVEFIV